jgi:hypothetical protein
MLNPKTYTLFMLLLSLSFAIACFEIIYFWVYFDPSQQLPLIIPILALCYLGIEWIKKANKFPLSKWNRIYYIGLFAVIAPVAFENNIDLKQLQILCKLGIFFLAIPIFIETRILQQLKNKEK